MTRPRARRPSLLVGAALAVLALPARGAGAEPGVVEPSIAGAVSGAAAAGAAAAAGRAEASGVARFVLVVGVNRGVDPELPQLHYADDDAARYSELFRALGGSVQLLTRADENTLRISAAAVSGAREPRRAELARAVAALAAGVAAARARGQRTMFYFVYAGHGNVNGSTAYLALEDARLDGEEIEREIVNKVRAHESHLIIDACYSYFLAYGRGPGGSRRSVPRPFASTEGLAHRADVGLLLSTTSARESHEWADFEAGIFSHEVRSGLYGAADLDGDGQISYLEIAAFISRANAAVPNERFRPRVFAHPPVAAGQLIDLRQAGGRRLRVDDSAQAGHYLFEDVLGVRFADFHSARGQALSLLVPASPNELYLRRVADDLEFAIPAAPEVVNLAELTPQPSRHARRGGGAAEYAFNLLFSLPFDDEAVASYQRSPVIADADVAVELVEPALPYWRRVTGYAALGGAVGAALVGARFAIQAAQLSREAHLTRPQTDADIANRRMADSRRWAEISLGVAGGAAIASAFALLWPLAPVRPAASLDGSSGTLGFAGGF